MLPAAAVRNLCQLVVLSDDHAVQLSLRAATPPFPTHSSAARVPSLAFQRSVPDARRFSPIQLKPRTENLELRGRQTINGALQPLRSCVRIGRQPRCGGALLGPPPCVSWQDLVRRRCLACRPRALFDAAISTWSPRHDGAPRASVTATRRVLRRQAVSARAAGSSGTAERLSYRATRARRRPKERNLTHLLRCRAACHPTHPDRAMAQRGQAHRARPEIPPCEPCRASSASTRAREPTTPTNRTPPAHGAVGTRNAPEERPALEQQSHQRNPRERRVRRRVPPASKAGEKHAVSEGRLGENEGDGPSPGRPRPRQRLRGAAALDDGLRPGRDSLCMRGEAQKPPPGRPPREVARRRCAPESATRRSAADTTDTGAQQRTYRPAHHRDAPAAKLRADTPPANPTQTPCAADTRARWRYSRYGSAHRWWQEGERNAPGCAARAAAAGPHERGRHSACRRWRRVSVAA
ncbi:hypothetical protein PsYK624_074730 [Phanerochaete sordida]|uniref:Uncharacterized protein n=1 Tax=Phanerochaete sordida TaxID=48140 RepID=A0A9P3GCH6_9APHY|nr:hypothetical protein PsYK624_074730 [Phanerochaete sordida]